jgi:hypothetical protein
VLVEHGYPTAELQSEWASLGDGLVETGLAYQQLNLLDHARTFFGVSFFSLSLPT